MKISACVLTHNSAKTLEKLFNSIDFIDEIIIVDDESTDETCEIAKKFKAKIFSHKLDGFGAQRNFAASCATNDWILQIDTDEIITSDLKKEIEIVKIASPTARNDSPNGYSFSRLTYFSGKPIRHCGWFPDYSIRLYDKTKMKFNETKVHEKIIPSGSIGTFRNPIHHYSYAGVSDYIKRLKKYTSLQSENPNVTKNHLNLLLMFVKPIYRFFKMYFIQLGILDGWRGLFLSIMSAYYDGRVHAISEARAISRSMPMILTILFIILAFSQGYIISKYGYLAISLPIALLIFLLVFSDLKWALAMVFLSIFTGQLTRINLAGGGAIVASDFVVPMFLLAFISYKLIKNPKINKTPINLSLFLLIIVFILTYIIALPHFFSISAAAYLIRIIMYFALFWPFYDFLHQSKANLKFGMRAFEWLMYALIAAGVFQLIYFNNLLFLMKYGWDPHLNRMVSTFLDPNFLSAFLNIGFAYALARFYSSKRPIYEKIWPVLIFALAIFLTYSRSGWLMMGIIALVFGIFRDKRIILIFAVLIVSAYLFVPRVSQRIQEGIDFQQSAGLRIAYWKQGEILIKHDPILGVGYNNLEAAKLQEGLITPAELSSHAAAGVDASLMDIWATTGIFGLLIFLYFVFKNIYLGFKSRSNFGLAIAGIFLGLLIHSIFLNSFLYPSIILAFVFMLAIFYNLIDKHEIQT